MKLYIGIDPGRLGAICVLYQSGGLLWCADAPLSKGKLDPLEIGALVGRAMTREGVRVAIEEPQLRHAGPRKGKACGMGIKSAHSQGVGWGYWVGAFAARGVVCDVVSPQAWQLEVLGKKSKRKDNKARSVAYATEHWRVMELHTPRGRVLDGRADAACIAEWCRRQAVGGGE